MVDIMLRFYPSYPQESGEEIPAHHGPGQRPGQIPHFYCNLLGLVEVRRKDAPQGRFTLVFLAAPGDEDAELELTCIWDPEDDDGRNFGHLAYRVKDIYAAAREPWASMENSVSW